MADINRNDQATGNVEGNCPSTVSERKRKANQQNSQKSTGPKDTRHTRFNALKHGLLAKRLIFSENGQLVDERLHWLFEDLQDKYGHGDVLVDLLIESVVTEYWRIAQGLKLEIRVVPLALEYDIHNGLGNLIRYGTASRRALQKNVEMLEKLSQLAPRGEAEDDDLLDDESPTPQVILPTDDAGSGQAGASVSEQPEAELETSGQPEDAVPKAA
jgi:hypothetical protein